MRECCKIGRAACTMFIKQSASVLGCSELTWLYPSRDQDFRQPDGRAVPAEIWHCLDVPALVFDPPGCSTVLGLLPDMLSLLAQLVKGLTAIPAPCAGDPASIAASGAACAGRCRASRPWQQRRRHHYAVVRGRHAGVVHQAWDLVP